MLWSYGSFFSMIYYCCTNCINKNSFVYILSPSEKVRVWVVVDVFIYVDVSAKMK